VPKTQIENAHWRLNRLYNRPVVSPVDIHIFLVRQRGMVQGFGGCNRIHGNYQLNGKNIGFTGLAITKKLCPGRMEEEKAFLDALKRTTGWDIEGQYLHFTTPKGELLAVFERY
jgi:heat shock protein HslJ